VPCRAPASAASAPTEPIPTSEKMGPGQSPNDTPAEAENEAAKNIVPAAGFLLWNNDGFAVQGEQGVHSA